MLASKGWASAPPYQPGTWNLEPKKALLAWSSGKDSAWALHVLRERGDVEVVGLLTTFKIGRAHV